MVGNASCLHRYFTENLEPPAGLEPAIPGLGGRCLIHWATEAIVYFLCCTWTIQRPVCFDPRWHSFNRLTKCFELLFMGTGMKAFHLIPWKDYSYKNLLHCPGIEPGSQEWESCMIPLHQQCRRSGGDSICYIVYWCVLGSFVDVYKCEYWRKMLQATTRVTELENSWNNCWFLKSCSGMSERRWCSGIMQDSHSCDPGSIPGRRIFILRF